jgi:protein-S-isoprenylcysteine O-methyltransferase Ste14
VIALGIVDWGSLAVEAWLRYFVAVPLWAAGNGLALWSMAVLGLGSTLGGEGALLRRGPYGFSRNPQYVGFMVALIGWSLVASSTWTLTASLAAFIPLILVPFVEEPWLMARHGPAYEAYKRAVPRFVSHRRRSNGV